MVLWLLCSVIIMLPSTLHLNQHWLLHLILSPSCTVVVINWINGFLGVMFCPIFNANFTISNSFLTVAITWEYTSEKRRTYPCTAFSRLLILWFIICYQLILLIFSFYETYLRLKLINYVRKQGQFTGESPIITLFNGSDEVLISVLYAFSTYFTILF